MLKFIRIPSLLAGGLLFISIGFSSCSTFDPPVTIPIYGHIDSVHFTTTYNLQGTASSKTPNVWVYLDDNPVGAFQLPCTFPMVGGNGTHNIKIFPAIILANGPSATSMNPLYKYYSVTLNMNQGSKYTFQPTSTYYPWVKFPYMEDFENEPPGNQPQYITNGYGSTSTMIVTRTKGDVFEGKGSGMAAVDGTHSKYIGETIADTLPTANATIYMEINYKATTYFELGMFIGTDSINGLSPVEVLPSAVWKKMYVDLSTVVQKNNTIGPYHVYFALNLESGHTNDTLLLDNIKIVD